MKKIKIVCTSDWHVSDRTHAVCTHALDEVVQVVEGEKPHYTMLLGDLTHVRGKVEGKSALLIKDTLRAMLEQGTNVLAIPGNHDLYRNGEGSNLDAIFGHTGVDDELVAAPPQADFRNLPWIAELTPEIGALMLPFYHKWQYDVEGTDEELLADLQRFIKGALAEMEDRGYTTRLCFTHLSIVGATLDNEQIMKVGHDLALPASAFDGFDLVVSGHLHRPQSFHMGTGWIVYIGALQPFTFGDRWTQPRVVIVEAGPEGHVAWHDYALTVKEPLLRLRFDMEEYTTHWNGLSIPLAVAQFIDVHDEGGRLHGARVRLELHLSRSQLALLDKEWQAKVARLHGLRELKLLPRRTDNDLIETQVKLDRLSFKELMELWLDEQPDMSPDDRASVLKWTDVIEQDHQVSEHDASFDHQPLWTTLHNWKQWANVTLEVDNWPETVCIHGDNAAGKSNLAEAEAFALYGQNMKGTRLINCIREGETECGVTHGFRSNGEEYIVARELKLTKNGTKTTLRLSQRTPEGPRELSVGTNRDTQALIDRLAGPFDHYRMRFAQQQDLAALIEATDEQRMDIFQRLLRYDLSARSDVAKQRLREHEETERIAKTTAEVLLEQNDSDTQGMPGWVRELFHEDASDVEAIQMALTDRREQIRETTAALERIEADDNRRVSRVRAIEADRARVWGMMDTLPKGRVTEAQERSNAASRDLRSATEARDRHLAARPAHVSEPAPIQYASLRESLTEAITAWEDDKAALDNLKEKHDAIEREFAGAEGELRALGSEAIDTKDLPCDGLYEDDGETDLWRSCPLLLGDIQRQERRSQLMQRIEALKSDLEQMEYEIDDAEAAADESETEVDELREEVAAIERRQTEWKAYKTWHDNLQSHEDRVAVAARAAVQANTDLKSARDDVEYALAARADYEKQIAGFDDMISKMDSGLVKVRANRRATSDQLTNLRLQVETLQHALATLRRIQERVDAARRERDRIAFSQRQQVALASYRRACSRTGIPLIFLKAIVPEYEALVNRILAPVELRYELQTTKTTSSDEERPALDQWFTDANGRHPVKEASGFQRVVLGVALRLALTKLHGDLTGSGATTVWQDEGWGAFSEQNIPVAAELIQNVCEVMGGRYVYITHVPELQETARARVQVTRSNSGSVIDVVLG